MGNRLLGTPAKWKIGYAGHRLSGKSARLNEVTHLRRPRGRRAIAPMSQTGRARASPAAPPLIGAQAQTNKQTQRTNERTTTEPEPGTGRAGFTMLPGICTQGTQIHPHACQHTQTTHTHARIRPHRCCECAAALCRLNASDSRSARDGTTSCHMLQLTEPGCNGTRARHRRSFCHAPHSDAGR